MAGTSQIDSDAELLDRARAVLDRVTDPELPFLNLREMGILRALTLNGDRLDVAITPTYSGCPAMDIIAIDVETALVEAGFKNFRVVRVLSPAWTTDWLSADAREKLRANGIAPPEKASGKRALFSQIETQCPKCGSPDTERVSEFGSTACKAHYRCLSCQEPFEYFKCI